MNQPKSKTLMSKKTYITEAATYMEKYYGYTFEQAVSILTPEVIDEVTLLCNPCDFVVAFVTYKQELFKAKMDFSNRIAK